MLLACRIFLRDTPIVSSYHTNIAFYAKLFGFSLLYEPIWATHRLYHSPSKYVLCPSHSTKDALIENGIPESKVIVWSRGVDTSMFSPSQRNQDLRNSWIFSSQKEKKTSTSQFRLRTKPNSQSNQSISTGISSSSNALNRDEGVAFGLSLPEDKVVILYVGRISWEKNLKVLVESFKKMNHEEFHLVIVGDGPAKQTIQNLLEPTGGVTFTGYLNGQKLAEAYASADIFAFPSVSETFGQVVLEAQASGLPVVAMQAEGVKEIVIDGISGVLVDPNNNESQVIDEYHNAIVQISSNGEIYKSMANQALCRSKTFTWDAAMNTCITTYKNAIHQTKNKLN